MTVSQQQIQNVKLGACNVVYGTVDLGLTKGGVNVSMSTQNKAINVDQFGLTVVNDYIMGRTGTVKVPMAETDINKLLQVIPGAVLVTDSVTPSKVKLVVPTAVGTSLIYTAQELVLHPTALAANDLSQDVTIPLASPTGNISFDFQDQNERVYSVEFTMYPNPTTGLLFTIGDPSASATDTTIVVSSGTYNTATGLVTLTLAGPHGHVQGDTIIVSSAAGTGAFASINGSFTAGPGTTGSVVTFTLPLGLTMTITGGNVEHA